MAAQYNDLVRGVGSYPVQDRNLTALKKWVTGVPLESAFDGNMDHERTRADTSTQNKEMEGGRVKLFMNPEMLFRGQNDPCYQSNDLDHPDQESFVVSNDKTFITRLTKTTIANANFPLTVLATCYRLMPNNPRLLRPTSYKCTAGHPVDLPPREPNASSPHD
ncbi:hypothetical protein PT974_08097 [Cladobotryum mycophilum]|uniref:Uncharacterized protein n=1 Tax=Cladobotryum mycophilum TaxID=491253 RepID=A0ABR0SDG5_9HYPO